MRKTAPRFPSVWVFLAFFSFTLVLYRSTLFDVPRSDHVVVFAYLQNLTFPADISQIAFLELLGQPRFQPLAWLFHFFQVKTFGFNFLFYHLVVVGLHAFNATLVFKLVRSISRKGLLAFLAALMFVSLFTHLPIIAWPIASYSLLSVSLSLLALLSLLKFYRVLRTSFLYLSYALVFVQLFLYELNVIAPAFVFLLSVALGWSHPNKRRLILKNLSLVAVVYLAYGGLYLGLMPIFAGLPHGVFSTYSILRALAAVPIEFFNTVFSHNIFASSQVVIDELLFYVPFTVKSFSITTMDQWLVRINFLAYLALFVLVITARRPKKNHSPWLWLLAAWAAGYAFMLFLGRGVAYVLSQARHAYFPALLLIVVLAFFFERHFLSRKSLTPETRSSFVGRNGLAMFAVACLIIVGLNIVKISWILDEYMEYRSYPNDIYYAARDWLSESANKEDRLFVSVTTYPSHEKLAWGTDIIPDLFLDDPRVTKNYQQATHILEWKDGHLKPTITALILPPEDDLGDDFAITFGLMPHPVVDEEYLEILAAPDTIGVESKKNRWWLRLYFEHGPGLGGGMAGIARVTLGYSMADEGHLIDSVAFKSQPIPIGQVRMTHLVLAREGKTLGLIVNGRLSEKIDGITQEDFSNMELSLGPLYRMAYRKPYYFAHTFAEFGRSSYSIQDKEVGHVFDSIQFKVSGFQGYHLSLNY